MTPDPPRGTIAGADGWGSTSHAIGIITERGARLVGSPLWGGATLGLIIGLIVGVIIGEIVTALLAGAAIGFLAGLASDLLARAANKAAGRKNPWEE